MTSDKKRAILALGQVSPRHFGHLRPSTAYSPPFGIVRCWWGALLCLGGQPPPKRPGKNHQSHRTHVNQIFVRGRTQPPPVDSPAFVNSPLAARPVNATKSGLLLRSAPPVRYFPTLILETFTAQKGRLFGSFPAERNKTKCYFVAFTVSNSMKSSGRNFIFPGGRASPL